ncbi:hypothetical protein AM588_10010762 [Phytophthora nicotianae]|uniref:Enoyl reductase (ER) domain-containing protein n=1 Tax=Phytophthora nicotianae TaxID=4792 RepID=A0A0W8DRJ7_PHYNI|nr:hypothetical protein AM588_10010762 [Phytophthora nicotianae]
MTQIRRHILVVGSVGADIVVAVDRMPTRGETLSASKPDTGNVYPGGKGNNQAATIAKLIGPSHPTLVAKMACQFGNDNHGKMIKDTLESVGVDTTLCIHMHLVPHWADLSAYWVPQLYVKFKNGTGYGLVESHQIVYYESRPMGDEKVIAFPDGLKMLAGNPTLREKGDSTEEKAITWVCLDYDNPHPEQQGIPNFKCPNGLRGQVNFPMCWNGVDLDSLDHKSHVAYATGLDGGSCPDGWKKMVKIFYEAFYNVAQYDDEWDGDQHPFVLANGDRTGFGFHGDFLNGWDIDVLQAAVDQCASKNYFNSGECAPLSASFSDKAPEARCTTQSEIVEDIMTVAKLPGNNPVDDEIAEPASNQTSSFSNSTFSSGSARSAEINAESANTEDSVAAIGAFSEYLEVPASKIIKSPELSPALVPLTVCAVSASLALEKAGQMKSNETVFVSAAAGATGQFAVQLAKLAGNHVIGACSSDEKVEYLKSLGVDRPINYKKEDLNAVLKKEYPSGIDLAFEGVGGDMFKAVLDNIAIFGRIIVFGNCSHYHGDAGNDPQYGYQQNRKMQLRSASLRGFQRRHHPKDEPEHLKRLVKLVQEGKLKAGVDPTVFKGFEGIPKALELGVVESVAEGVTDISVGETVAYQHLGAFAEYTEVPTAKIVKTPELSPSVIPLTVCGVSASLALERAGEMKSNETVFVSAAAGATGQFVVQLAKLAGNHVIGACSSDEKVEYLKSLGVDRPINYKKEDLNEVLKKEYPEGINLAFESVGGELFKAVLDNIAIFGRIIVFGNVSHYHGDAGMDPQYGYQQNRKMQLRSASLHGFLLFHHAQHVPEHLQHLLTLIKEGKLKAGIDPTNFRGLESIPDAIDRLYAQKNIGKLVIRL